jgi:hypothetical protein
MGEKHRRMPFKPKHPPCFFPLRIVTNQEYIRDCKVEALANRGIIIGKRALSNFTLT